MKTYCSECNKEIKEGETSFTYLNGFVCWHCNAELSGLSEYITQLLSKTHEIHKRK